VKARAVGTFLACKSIKISAIWGKNRRFGGNGTKLRRLFGYENAKAGALIDASFSVGNITSYMFLLQNAAI
jgi:hypothetical protein